MQLELEQLGAAAEHLGEEVTHVCEVRVDSGARRVPLACTRAWLPALVSQDRKALIVRSGVYLLIVLGGGLGVTLGGVGLGETWAQTRGYCARAGAHGNTDAPRHSPSSRSSHNT